MNSKVMLLLISCLLIFGLNTPIILAKNHQIKLVVFDFDGTITDKPQRQPLLPENESAFKDLVQYLIKNGIQVGIATYGSNPQKRLDEMFGEDNPFHMGNVMFPYCVDPSWKAGSPSIKGYSKKTMLKKISKYYNIHHKDAILFIDDRLENIQSTQKAGYLVHHVDPPYSGMSVIAPEIKKIIERKNTSGEKKPSGISNPMFKAFFFFSGVY